MDLAQWNANLSGQWNKLLTKWRRTTPGIIFIKVTEPQTGSRRGDGEGRMGLNYHGVVVSPDPLVKAQFRKLAIHYGFGHEVDIQPLPVESRSAARYISKYVTKAASHREKVPWLKVNRRTGEMSTRATYRTWTASHAWAVKMREIREVQRQARIRRALQVAELAPQAHPARGSVAEAARRMNEQRWADPPET